MISGAFLRPSSTKQVHSLTFVDLICPVGHPADGRYVSHIGRGEAPACARTGCVGLRRFVSLNNRIKKGVSE